MRSREWRSDGCSSDLQESLIDRPAKVRSDQRPIFPLLPSVPLQNILGIFVEDRQKWQDQLTVPDGPRIFQFHLELARWRPLRLLRRLEQKPVRAGRKRAAQPHEYVRRMRHIREDVRFVDHRPERLAAGATVRISRTDLNDLPHGSVRIRPETRTA